MLVRPVYGGRVPQRVADFDGAAEGLARVVVVRETVALTEPHCAVTELGDGKGRGDLDGADHLWRACTRARGRGGEREQGERERVSKQKRSNEASNVDSRVEARERRRPNPPPYTMPRAVNDPPLLGLSLTLPSLAHAPATDERARWTSKRRRRQELGCGPAKARPPPSNGPSSTSSAPVTDRNTPARVKEGRSEGAHYRTESVMRLQSCKITKQMSTFAPAHHSAPPAGKGCTGAAAGPRAPHVQLLATARPPSCRKHHLLRPSSSVPTHDTRLGGRGGTAHSGTGHPRVRMPVGHKRFNEKRANPVRLALESPAV